LPSEVARDLKASMRWVSERLDELRKEIERQRKWGRAAQDDER
jgi:hypothetical protein